MKEDLQAIRDEWRNGGLARCLEGVDCGPSYAFDERGKLKKWRNRDGLRITMRDVDNAVSQVTGTGIEMMHANRRDKHVVRPRQMAMLLMREFCLARSFPEIGRHFEDKDHTTVIHAVARAKDLLEEDPDFFEAHARARYILMELQA